MSRCLAFFKEMITYHQIILDQFLVVKAYLLFQKFLKEGALLYLDFVPTPVVEQMERQLLVATELEEPRDGEAGVKITTSFFDDILREVEDLMATSLFKDYFRSEFFQ